MPVFDFIVSPALSFASAIRFGSRLDGAWVVCFFDMPFFMRRGPRRSRLLDFPVRNSRLRRLDPERTFHNLAQVGDVLHSKVVPGDFAPLTHQNQRF